eukprot:g26563.t1
MTLVWLRPLQLDPQLSDPQAAISEDRREIEGLVTWYNENNLSLNICKTKELIINFRKKGREHAPIYINRTEVERDREKLQKVVCTAQTITEANLPSMDS